MRYGSRLGLGLFVLAVAAPTAGDIGSCGEPIAELDPGAFFAEKRANDCEKCSACNFASQACRNACRGTGSPDKFGENCFPLVHDGRVCLNALRAAGCGEYQSYVDDLGATVPTECNFCPLSGKPGAGGSK